MIRYQRLLTTSEDVYDIQLFQYTPKNDFNNNRNLSESHKEFHPRSFRNEVFLPPYRLHIDQQVKDSDYEARTKFSNYDIDVIELHSLLLSSATFTDKYVFYMDGEVIKQYVRI